MIGRHRMVVGYAHTARIYPVTPVLYLSLELVGVVSSNFPQTPIHNSGKTSRQGVINGLHRRSLARKDERGAHKYTYVVRFYIPSYSYISPITLPRSGSFWDRQG